MSRDDYGHAYTDGFAVTTRFLMSRGLSPETARELAQAAWAKGWERRAQLREPALIRTWVNTIALNLHRSQRRSEPDWQELPNLPTTSRTELSIDADRLLRLCSAADRQLLQQCYWQGRSTEDIAQQCGLNPNTVRIRLFRIRRRIGSQAGAVTGRLTSR